MPPRRPLLTVGVWELPGRAVGLGGCSPAGAGSGIVSTVTHPSDREAGTRASDEEASTAPTLAEMRKQKSLSIKQPSQARCLETTRLCPHFCTLGSFCCLFWVPSGHSYGHTKVREALVPDGATLPFPLLGRHISQSLPKT